MKRLSSLLLTLYALGAVVVFLITGMVLAQVKPFSLAMPSMDHGIILDWFLAAWRQGGAKPWLAIWLAALCASVGLLVLNLCACTWTRLIPRLAKGSGLHRWLLLLAHVLMIIILMGHLSQMIMGFKLDGVRFLPGQEHSLPEGYSVRLESLRYVNDPALLNLTYRQARRAQTASSFSREKNQIKVSLWQNGQRLAEGRLRVLEPLVSHGLRLTLSDFYRDDSGAKPKVGALLAINHNPLTNLFFAAYLAWISVYVALAVWAFVAKGRGNHKQEEKENAR